MKTMLNEVQNAQVINSLNSLSRVLADAKCGGQFVTLEIVKPVKMNAFPTDGSERVHRDASFIANNYYELQLNYAADYDKKMAKALGVESYESHDSNREHIVKNVLMCYKSTGNVCFIYIDAKYLSSAYVNAKGEQLNEQELAYMNRYLAKKSDSAPVAYRNISVKYIKSIAMGGKKYIVNISADVQAA